MPNFSAFLTSNSHASIPWRNAYPIAGEERGWGTVRCKLPWAQRDEASCVRMMRSSSHCESKQGFGKQRNRYMVYSSVSDMDVSVCKLLYILGVYMLKS